MNTFSHSNHRYINISLNFIPIVKKNLRYKTKGKNLKKFYSDIKENINGSLSSLLAVENVRELDNWISSFHEHLDGIIGQRFKLSWYSADLKLMRKRLKDLYKRVCRNESNMKYKVEYYNFRKK